jgi:hypothetical protein
MCRIRRTRAVARAYDRESRNWPRPALSRAIQMGDAGKPCHPRAVTERCSFQVLRRLRCGVRSDSSRREVLPRRLPASVLSRAESSQGDGGQEGRRPRRRRRLASRRATGGPWAVSAAARFQGPVRAHSPRWRQRGRGSDQRLRDAFRPQAAIGNQMEIARPRSISRLCFMPMRNTPNKPMRW